jgi:hypothetical protein
LIRRGLRDVVPEVAALAPVLQEQPGRNPNDKDDMRIRRGQNSGLPISLTMLISQIMMPSEHQARSASNIGLKLVSHSRSTEFSANRGLVIELFPFIFEASQRMSARAISRFLADEQGLKLSAVTITKALNDPQKSWNSFFDAIEPSARIIARWWRRETLDFLFTGKAKYDSNIEKAIGNPVARFAAKLILEEDVVSADKILKQKWFCINKVTLEKARPYLESRLVVWAESKEKAK